MVIIGVVTGAVIHVRAKIEKHVKSATVTTPISRPEMVACDRGQWLFFEFGPD